MEPTLSSIKRLHKLVTRNLFFIDGKLDYPRLRTACTKLLDAVHEYDGDNDELWYIGEYDSCDMASLCVALFWHSADYLDGKDTDSMVLNTSASNVFKPGMSCGPEEETSEIDAYNALNELAGKHYDTTRSFNFN